EPRDAVLDEVVAQVHDERIVANEVGGDLDRVRETERRLLLDVGDVDAEARAVADRGADLGLAVHHHRDLLAGARILHQQLARISSSARSFFSATRSSVTAARNASFSPLRIASRAAPRFSAPRRLSAASRSASVPASD